MADHLSPVNLPPIASTGDAPPHESDPRGNDRNKKNRSSGKAKSEIAGQNTSTVGSQPQSGEKKSPTPDVDFERTDHELDSFA